MDFPEKMEEHVCRGRNPKEIANINDRRKEYDRLRRARLSLDGSVSIKSLVCS
jgi:hypothetical protein